LRDLALQLSILRRIPSRQAATGFPFPGREYGGLGDAAWLSKY
jgi:hypothetical protein